MKGELEKRVETIGSIFSPFRGSMMFILDQYIELWIAYGKGKKEENDWK